MLALVRNTLVVSILTLSAFVHAAENAIPPLPTKGFVTGRIATQADVKSGNAAFATLPEQKVMRVAIPIPIPQYAFYRTKGKQVLAFVIQVEKVNGKPTIGAKLVENGEIVIGTPTDFQMLGVDIAAK